MAKFLILFSLLLISINGFSMDGNAFSFDKTQIMGDIVKIKELNNYKSLGRPLLITDNLDQRFVLKLDEHDIDRVVQATTIYKKLGLVVPKVYKVNLSESSKKAIQKHLEIGDVNNFPDDNFLFDDGQYDYKDLKARSTFLIMPFYEGKDLNEIFNFLSISSTDIRSFVYEKLVPVLPESFIAALVTGVTDSTLCSVFEEESILPGIQINKGSFFFTKNGKMHMDISVQTEPLWLLNRVLIEKEDDVIESVSIESVSKYLLNALEESLQEIETRDDLASKIKSQLIDCVTSDRQDLLELISKILKMQINKAIYLAESKGQFIEKAISKKLIELKSTPGSLFYLEE